MSGKEEELVDSNFLNHETFGRDAQPIMIRHIYVGHYVSGNKFESQHSCSVCEFNEKLKKKNGKKKTFD